MLETLTDTDWTRHIGTRFDVDAGEQTLALHLDTVDVLGGTPSATRKQYSLVFTGPATPILDQASWPVRHEALGGMHLFLVPIGPAADGMQYEAVFT